MPAPFRWTDAIEQRICEELAGGASMHDIALLEGMPSEPTIYRRMASDTDFSALISAAREAQQDFVVDQCVRLADEADEENWQVVKLRIWARQWRAAKLAPKKYGDKQDINLNANVAVSNLTDEEIIAELALLKPAIPAPDGNDLV